MLPVMRLGMIGDNKPAAPCALELAGDIGDVRLANIEANGHSLAVDPDRDGRPLEVARVNDDAAGTSG
ncbi:unannotated protein [freshwater metagenome]|uniref:Unannotated protein n=1 Tax=freshwater metagenome TaxID=449393 RepID=A0A6J6SE81_9ZZZZ